jgi:hypothetical protein
VSSYSPSSSFSSDHALTNPQYEDESQVEKEARSPSQAQEKKDESQIVSVVILQYINGIANNFPANKLLAPSISAHHARAHV